MISFIKNQTARKKKKTPTERSQRKRTDRKGEKGYAGERGLEGKRKEASRELFRRKLAQVFQNKKKGKD